LILLTGCEPKPEETPGGASTTGSVQNAATDATAPSSAGVAAPSETATTQGPGDAKAAGEGKEVTTASGLKYVDLKVGTGASPAVGQMVRVHYTGTLENGKKFDSSHDHPGGEPFEFPIGTGKVIKGWDEGVMTMKVGGRRKLTVPADLAYGENSPDPSVIPNNATLIFDVELLDVK
jgi:peptidylprolyl isomerase